MKRALSLLLVLGWIGLSHGSALAVEYGGVGANPANPDPANPRTQSIFVYSLDGGASKQDAVRVVNNGDNARTISLYVVDSQISTGGALACAQAVDVKSDVGTWVTLNKNQLSIPAHQTEIVPFSLDIPKNASVGEHNGCLVVQDITTKPEADASGVALSFRSALRMIVTIRGEVNSALSFTNVSHELKNDKFVVRPTVRNEGNVSVDASISTSLTNILGQRAGSSGGEYPVLPQTSANWNFEINRPFWGGVYRVATTANYPADPTKPIGVSQKSHKTARATTSWVWITPRPLAAAIELTIIAVIGFAALLAVYLGKVVATWEKHKIRKRDTLHSLAKERHVHWRLLALVNRVRPPYSLEAGRWLRVPKKRS